MPAGRGRSTAVALALTLAALGSDVARPTAAAAQQVQRETQVPIDAERGVVEIDPRLRDELGLFAGLDGFVSARLFRSAAGQHVLEVTYREAGSLAHERRALSDAELAAFRADVQQRLADLGRERVVLRDGRAGLVVGQAAVGLGYHGWALGEAMDVDSDRGRVATYLLTSGASFLVPWLLTQDRAVTIAQRDLFFWGATRGIAYGHVIGHLVAPDDPRDFFDGNESERRTRLALGSAGSVLGSVLGFRAARDAGPGTVALWSAAGDFGLAGAFGTSYALGLFDEEVSGPECPDGTGPCEVESIGSMRAGHAATLALGLASLWGAKRWSDARDYTVGDARALRSFGLLGAQAALPIAIEAFDPDDGGTGNDKAVVASTVLAGAAGLFLGDRLLAPTSLTGGEGLLVLAGHVAGGLGALGVTYLLDGSSSADETLYLATSAAGSAIGSILTFRAVRGATALPDGSGDARAGSARGLANAQVEVQPTALLTGAPLLTVRF